MENTAPKNFSVIEKIENGDKVFFSVPTSYTISDHYPTDEKTAEYGSDLCYYPIEFSEPAAKRKWAKILQKGEPIAEYSLMREHRVKIRKSDLKNYAKALGFEAHLQQGSTTEISENDERKTKKRKKLLKTSKAKDALTFAIANAFKRAKIGSDFEAETHPTPVDDTSSPPSIKPQRSVLGQKQTASQATPEQVSALKKPIVVSMNSSTLVNNRPQQQPYALQTTPELLSSKSYAEVSSATPTPISFNLGESANETILPNISLMNAAHFSSADHCQVLHDIVIKLNEIHNEQVRMNARLEEFMLKERNAIVSIGAKLESVCSGGIGSNISRPKEIILDFPFKPVASREDMDYLEKMAVSKEFINECCSVALTICGTNMSAQDVSLKLVDMIFDRPFLVGCSWAGGSRDDIKKIGFKYYNATHKMFFACVKSCSKEKDYNLEQTQNFFRMQIKNAKQRAANLEDNESGKQKRVSKSRPNRKSCKSNMEQSATTKETPSSNFETIPTTDAAPNTAYYLVNSDNSLTTCGGSLEEFNMIRYDIHLDENEND